MGSLVGLPVDLAVGSPVGSLVGSTVGALVGEGVGLLEGSAVGAAVGLLEGSAVARAVFHSFSTQSSSPLDAFLLSRGSEELTRAVTVCSFALTSFFVARTRSQIRQLARRT